MQSSQNRFSITFTIKGCSQGIGLRPTVFRLAKRLSLTGLIQNTHESVLITVEGRLESLEGFDRLLHRVLKRHDSQAVITEQKHKAKGLTSFRIADSEQPSHSTIDWCCLQPDQAICSTCAHELRNPSNRRYQYPFLACADCGPRYAICLQPPFDRAHTSYRQYPLCETCQREYSNPLNRRFHAQSISCPNCGPKLYLTTCEQTFSKESGHSVPALLRQCATLLSKGHFLAVKTLHGYQLWANAKSSEAIKTLRDVKQRPQKPFAVMFPHIQDIQAICDLTESARAVLQGPKRPIALLPLRGSNKNNCALALNALAPQLNQLGCMLPTSALHQLIFEFIDFPLVVTSANRSGEPIEGNNQCVHTLLHTIVSATLEHDLEIIHPVDDSVVQFPCDEIQIIRRARGWVPAPIALSFTLPRLDAIGLGAGENISVASIQPSGIYLSPPLRQIGSLRAHQRFNTFIAQAMGSECNIREQTLEQFVCDRHPDFLTTLHAEHYSQHSAQSGHTPLPVFKVQHHQSHLYAALNEHGFTQGPTLGFIWDGFGLGTDNKAWGGECFIYENDTLQTTPVRRIASLSPFQLLGFDQASKQGWRVALSLLTKLYQEQRLTQAHFSKATAPLLNQHPEASALLNFLMKHEHKSSRSFPLTSSMGRLFDGVSSLLHICDKNSYQSEAALKLMAAAQHVDLPIQHHSEQLIPEKGLSFTFSKTDTLMTIEWEKAICELVQALHLGECPRTLAYKFHLGLATLCTDLVTEFCKQTRIESVVFSGGVWQNVLLAQLTIKSLKQRYPDLALGLARTTPANDTGIAVGQLIALGLIQHKH